MIFLRIIDDNFSVILNFFTSESELMDYIEYLYKNIE